MGKEVLARKCRPRDWRERDGMILLEEREVTDDWSRCDNRRVLIRGTDRKEFRVTHTLYSAAELREFLGECGFERVEMYGSLAGSPHDHEADRLIALAARGD